VRGQGEDAVLWRPTKRQTQFLGCPAFETLYGGAASGGKTEAIVLGALRWVGESSYRALIMRRTFPELNRDIVPLSMEYYPVAGGKYHVGDKVWRFPSGAVIEFGHAEGEGDVQHFKGVEVQYLAFDELTSFTEKQYRYLLSRARSSKGIPIRIRSATNPGGVGHDWVFKRWRPWLDRREDYTGTRAEADAVLWYETDANGEDIYVPRREDTLSRAFFPAKVQDNPHIMTHDPGYVIRLGSLDPVTRAQLRDGDWLIKPARGLYFQRGWFGLVDVRPAAPPIRIRRWDLASTEGDGDWTVGVLMSSDAQGRILVEDVIRKRLRPSGVEATVLATARLDPRGTRIWLPQDPGQAGKSQCESYARLLSGFSIHFERETGDKITRAQPFSAQCEAGNVSLVRAPWNEAYLQCLEGFPEGTHDDDVDASSGAYAQVVAALPNVAYLKAIEVMRQAGGRP
jgi:predicted phage terminase large subunit-like protein